MFIIVLYASLYNANCKDLSKVFESRRKESEVNFWSSFFSSHQEMIFVLSQQSYSFYFIATIWIIVCTTFNLFFFLINRDTRIRSFAQFIFSLETSTVFFQESLCLSRTRHKWEISRQLKILSKEESILKREIIVFEIITWLKF